MAKLPTMRNDNSEILPYNFNDYYVFFGVEHLSDHPNNTMFNHWHEDVEFVTPIRGHMVYNISGVDVKIEPGEGLFVNTQQIHYGFADDNSDCEFLYILWHPMLLCASGSIEHEFIKPVLVDPSIPYIHLTKDIGWQENILAELHQMKDYFKFKSAPLLLQSAFYKIWSLIYENAYHGQIEYHSSSHQLSILKDMLLYITKHYSSKIYLESIADAGNVSISCCNQIFKKYMKESPVKYLLNYRLLTSCDLLVKTDNPITDISYSVGFFNLSYYIDYFRKKFDCTPNEYRKNHKE